MQSSLWLLHVVAAGGNEHARVVKGKHRVSVLLPWSLLLMPGEDLGLAQSISNSHVLICGSAWAQHIWQVSAPVCRGSLCFAVLSLATEGTRRLWPERAFQTH